MPRASTTRGRRTDAVSSTAPPSHLRTCETVRRCRLALARSSLTVGRMSGDPVITRAGGRQPSEQQRAAQQLRALAKPYRFRVRADTEGFPIIPGRYGQIEWHCDGVNCWSCALPGQLALAVYSDRPRLFEKLWAIPGVRRHQTGDTEMRAVFGVEALEPVARVIRAHRKPGIRSEVAKKIGSRTAFGGTSRHQKTRFESSQGLRLGAAARPESEAAE